MLAEVGKVDLPKLPYAVELGVSFMTSRSLGTISML